MVSLSELKATYAGKRVLVTGHTGFKGAWLIQILHELGAEVMGYSLEPEKAEDLFVVINGSALFKSVIGDIRDGEKVQHEISGFKPDFVFHLAAQSLVRRSYEQPVYTWEVNVTGTAHVLEALRGLQQPCVAVCITTDKVYENPEKGVPFTEADPLGGYDPYSASKAGSELVIASYRRSFFTDSPVRLASARAGNVIGGGDFASDRIVPDFVRARLAGKSLSVRRPDAVRPWQHVLEPLAGYLILGARLALQPKLAAAFNFGPETKDVLTVKELIQQAEMNWPGEPAVFAGEAEGPHEAGLLLLDITKAKNELGFAPVWNSREAIRQTILWYKNAEVSEREKCREQILAYFRN